MITYVVLLRGINVGGHSIVRMAVLKSCLEALGFKDVKTYINSGNVILRSREADLRALESTIEKALAHTFSSDIRVVVRSLADMHALLQQLPKSWQMATDLKCNVIFLRRTIDTPHVLDNFSPKPGIEEMYYHPGTLLWSAKTSDLTKSSMVKLASSPLYQEMTVRILNSVRKTYEIMRVTDELPIAS